MCYIVSTTVTSKQNVLNRLDRFSDTYCTSKKSHFITTHDAVDERLVDNRRRLIVRCVNSQDRVIEFQPEAPKIL